MRLIIAGLMLISAAAVGYGCGGGSDEIPEDREAPSGIPRLDGGGPVIDEDTICPADRPKVGEACPRRFPEDKVCRFDLDPCVRGGAMFDSWVEYCCLRGTWDLCGMLSKCDELPADPDGGAAADASNDVRN